MELYLLLVFFLSMKMLNCFVSSMVYCIVLMSNCLMIGFYLFLVYGLMWYPLILFLVKMGGVYILFLFMSLHDYKDSKVKSVKLISFSMFSMLFFFFFYKSFFQSKMSLNKKMFLVSSENSLNYILLCIYCFFSFFILSKMMSSKESFIR